MENLEVIYEDSEIVVINKPAGVVVNKSNTYSGTTIQELLSVRDTPAQDSVPEEEESDFNSRNGVVHRLDKDTSGILVIAKTAETFVELQRQFKSREVSKQYYAVALGKAPAAKFEVTAPIGRNPHNRLEMAVVEGGRECRTLFELVKETTLDDELFSGLKVTPATGRTHQIRVHLASLNIPVAGDPFYSTKRQFEAAAQHFSRMMLHAYLLKFTHPKTKKIVHFEAKLPAEFNGLI
jgi:23S rRNA pseudouridine1911/1915/1917 synthase